jgi:hypothetical protein
MDDVDAALAAIRLSPADRGRVELIARRPAAGEREVLAEAVLDLNEGLVGDNWSVRPSSSTPDGSPHPQCQITLMSCRAAALFAGPRERWALAGDQLYVDLDLSLDNLPAGTGLRLGTAVLEISEKPHTGCRKFTERFGVDAFRLISSDVGRALRLRGVNARVVAPGTVSVGCEVAKILTAVASERGPRSRPHRPCSPRTAAG